MRRSTSSSLRGASAMLLSSTSTTPGVCSNTRAHRLGDLAPAVGLGAVDLGDERRQHRRARRHFDHLDVGAVALADGLQRGAHARGDGVALLAAVVLVDQVHLQVADLAAAAQVVLAHQAVEVDRRGGAGVGLVVGDLGHGGQVRRRVRAARAAVRSTGVPAGMSTTTWNSDLLSNGSIFSTTSPSAGSASDSAISAATNRPSSRRLRAPRAVVEQRTEDALEQRREPCRQAVWPAWHGSAAVARPPAWPSSRCAPARA